MVFPPEILQLLKVCHFAEAVPMVKRFLREASDERFSTAAPCPIGGGWNP